MNTDIVLITCSIYDGVGFNINTYDKPWKDGSGNSNKASSFSLSNKPNEIFELVKDIEDDYYSIHFKTSDKNSLTNEEKNRLIEIIALQLPIGAKLSTWGSVTKGGFSGLNRFTQFGFIKISETRNSGNNIIPIYKKVNIN